MVQAKTSPKLTERQARFVAEFFIDLNATAAARRSGYSARTAEVQGPRLLGNVRVAAAIAAGKEKLLSRLEATAQRVIQELARIALADPRKLFNADGSLKPASEWDDETAATVASVESSEEFAGRGGERQLIGYTKKLKQWDKVAALKTLAQHFGLLVEKKEHSGPDGGPIEVEVNDSRPVGITDTLRRLRAGLARRGIAGHCGNDEAGRN